ncbi:type II toxin-antitoxin system MqsA family antitoxin [Desulfonatronum thioautotrophicum]|uniref:type II toxin-antitoxin system MqsA family antitoxin n=1 Tax=Desulfonatronum thioautotrophicum TaxID=617001 RepID=UPI000A00ECA6|nr:type II toxin-antitoxin system MqsA family antitoxin [Desulfonatronum thioautotrophicum]
MKNNKCHFCSCLEYDQRKVDYLYSYKGNYLLVPNTPVEVCVNCGMLYYDAKILKAIEKQFFAVQNKTKNPDCYFEIPRMAYRDDFLAETV